MLVLQHLLRLASCSTEILAGNAKKVGDYFTAKLEKLPHVKEVRHQGLLVGVEFDDTISGVDVKHGCFRPSYAYHSNRKPYHPYGSTAYRKRGRVRQGI